MSLLHYITYKLVIIRDRRIGVIYYVIAIAVILYSLAEIFVKKGYLEVRNSNLILYQLKNDQTSKEKPAKQLNSSEK